MIIFQTCRQMRRYKHLLLLWVSSARVVLFSFVFFSLAQVIESSYLRNAGKLSQELSWQRSSNPTIVSRKVVNIPLYCSTNCLLNYTQIAVFMLLNMNNVDLTFTNQVPILRCLTRKCAIIISFISKIKYFCLGVCYK